VTKLYEKKEVYHDGYDARKLSPDGEEQWDEATETEDEETSDLSRDGPGLDGTEQPDEERVILGGMEEADPAEVSSSAPDAGGGQTAPADDNPLEGKVPAAARGGGTRRAPKVAAVAGGLLLVLAAAAALFLWWKGVLGGPGGRGRESAVLSATRIDQGEPGLPALPVVETTRLELSPFAVLFPETRKETYLVCSLTVKAANPEAYWKLVRERARYRGMIYRGLQELLAGKDPGSVDLQGLREELVKVLTVMLLPQGIESVYCTRFLVV